MEWSNWSRLESVRPRRVAEPTTVEAVVAEVVRARERGGRVKAVGTGHSFTGIAVADDTLLLPGGMTGITAVDRGAMTVTAWAGTPLKVLNAELERLGLSLHNMGDIAEQTLAGATSTGTHGTGGVVAGLAQQLAAVELVTGTGEVVVTSESQRPDLFGPARLGLGALGVLTRVTFHVEPLFALQAEEQPMGWDEALSAFDQMVAESHHVDLYWFPHTDRVLVKRNDRLDVDPADLRPLGRLREWWDDELLSNTVFGVLTSAGSRVPRLVPPVNRFSARALSARSYSDVAHRVFTSQRRVRFREMEYAVPRAAGLTALREVRQALEGSGLRVGFPVEVRVAPADDLPLSAAYGRDTCYLAFHTPLGTDHVPYFALVEAIMREHEGRPHWGKLHTRTAADLAPAYPLLDEFLAVRDRLDPDRVFANDHLDRVLGP